MYRIVLCFVPVTIGGAIGHNKPLKHRRPKWKSDVRLTEAQLQQKRDEFWDTAPAFDGRAEIWDALKASVQALESGDHQLAQAILDGAGISLPNGIPRFYTIPDMSYKCYSLQQQITIII